MSNNDLQELKSLTTHLSERQDAILEEWEKRLSEMEGMSTELSAISKEEFRNSIPDFLNYFYESLEGKEVSLDEIGKKHGYQRWEHSFDLDQAIKEWGTLHKVLVDEINSFQDEFTLSSASLTEIHGTLTAHIQEGIESSVNKFSELQKRETEAQFRDLEEVLEEPDEGMRDQDLRDTSHDLKGMVKNIQIGLSLLEDEKLTQRSTELIDSMSAAADNLEQLLKDLLDLFRLETNREEVNVTEFNVTNVLTNLCKSMQPTAKKERLELNYSGAGPLQVETDQKKIERIARNLILNALKYTQEGRIEVKWEEVSNDQWMLQVSDTGPGLDATHARSLSTKGYSSETNQHEKSSITDRDSTSSEVESHGEGIGLLIVRHLCKLLDALIEIETEPDMGTMFRITFPLVLSEE